MSSPVIRPRWSIAQTLPPGCCVTTSWPTPTVATTPPTTNSSPNWRVGSVSNRHPATAVADADGADCTAWEQPGGINHTDTAGGRDAATINSDRGLVSRQAPRPGIGRLGLGQARRVGAGGSPPRCHRSAAVHPDPPPTALLHRPMPHLPPIHMASPMAPPPFSLHRVAPGPRRTAGTARQRRSPPQAGQSASVRDCCLATRVRGHAPEPRSITMLWWFYLGSIVTLFGAQLNVCLRNGNTPAG